ncbi:MAG: glycosyltransferase [Solirubrobacterales bacterium]|nr:MAG: glycosyltransferase [Solirubrobacterales bacterium]
MKVGIVSKWIASGQAVVARQLRSALDDLGHESFVLARPGSGPRAQKAASATGGDTDAVWDQPGITKASDHHVPLSEYEDWVRANSIGLILCDENYQFDEINHLREQGLRTIGRFVWEYFGPEHAHGAKTAFETIYSMTLCERERYAGMGIESPYVPWGIHPELLDWAKDGDVAGLIKPGTPGGAAEDVAGYIPEDVAGLVRFYFPGGILGRRKPIRKVVKAFRRAQGEHLRLIISGQVPRKDEFLAEAAVEDPRIELALEDEPENAHRARFAACDVCLAPSRWEGLGLPLYEATAFGLPVITNDKPPMSEMVLDGLSGILVASTPQGEARSGITAWDPDPGELTAAIERLGDRRELERMRGGVAELREQRNWKHTVAALRELLS